MKVGQNDRALGELQAIKHVQGVDQFVQSAAARNSLLMLLLQRNARLPAADRDWKDIDELVAATAKITRPARKSFCYWKQMSRSKRGNETRPAKCWKRR